MPALWGRKVQFSIGQAGAAGVLLADLRVAFEVRMDRGSKAHTGKFRVWNVNPLTLATLDAGPLPTVQLKVGYGDGTIPGGGEGLPRSVFLGEVIRDGLRVERSGVDRIAEITAKDTPGAYQLGRVSLTFPSPVTHSAVVAMIAGQLGLVVGGIMIPADVTLAQGGTFFGAATQFLDRIAATTNCDWWISDGVFFFVGKGAPAPGASAPVFSSLAGNLIGTPIKRDRGKVEVKALLDATMRPGLTFSVVSESIKGSFIADSVEFTGDSGYDQPFYVRVIGRPPGT